MGENRGQGWVSELATYGSNPYVHWAYNSVEYKLGEDSMAGNRLDWSFSEIQCTTHPFRNHILFRRLVREVNDAEWRLRSAESWKDSNEALINLIANMVRKSTL